MSKPKMRPAPHALIDEPPLLVTPTAIMLFGVDEAIFLQQLHYWLRHAGKERDDRLWIYNTFDDWHTQFPWWSVRTIQRIVEKLRKSGVVLTSTRYNAHKSDRTLWYSIDYDALERKTKSVDHYDKMAGWSRHSGVNVPDTMASSDPDKLASSRPKTTSKTIQRNGISRENEKTIEDPQPPPRMQDMTPEEWAAYTEEKAAARARTAAALRASGVPGR